MAEDISPLEYARTNMLSRDHKADQSGVLELENLCLQARQNEINLNDTLLPSFDFGLEIKVEERLQISKSAAMLIQSIKRMDVLNLEISQNILSFSGDQRVAKSFNLELPLLHSDHEADCRNFAYRDDFEIKIQDVKLPLEIIDKAGTHNLTLNPELWNLGPDLIEKLRREKLCVSRNTVSYLQEIIRKDLWTVVDEESMWNSQQKYKKLRDRSVVTPPLSPKEPSPQLYQPSSCESLYQISLLSDPVSPTKRELKELESGIFQQDIPTPFHKSIFHSSHDHSEQIFYGENEIDLGCVSPQLKQLENPNYQVEQVPRLKRDSLKIDETLTPISSNIVYPDPDDFSNIFKVLEGDVKIYQDTPDLEQKLFEDTFLSAYESANQEVEQEELIEADATCRVTVPNMDFSKKEPVWKIFEKAINEPSKLLSLQTAFMKECVGSSPTLRIPSANIDHKLQWNPFPLDLNSKITDEEFLISAESNLEYFIQNEEQIGIIDSSNTVWKVPGLRILTVNEESENEIKTCLPITEIPLSNTTLTKKRKIKTKKHKTRILNSTENCEEANLISSTPNLSMDSGISNQCKDLNEPSILSGAFSACNALENFLEIRGAKKLKLMKSQYFSESHLKSPDSLDRECTKFSPSVSFPHPQRASIPALPECHDQPRSVVISSALFKNRLLMKTIEKLLPKLNLIERDFTIYNSIGWMHGSITPSSIITPLASDADIIISPTTGVIMTTLQKVRQKPLPGQKTQSSIRALLASISTRYENLIVLVSEDRADECTIGLNESDCLALSEFIGFTISLETLVIVKFIGGGEETLAHWLVNFMVKYNIEIPAPMQDETYWEVFLRRAGFNVLAAQAVISQLKTPLDPCKATKGGSNCFGLMAFVGMSARQRMHQFGHLVGKYIIERVSTMIDSTWTI
ncbi:putative nucleoporin nup49 [Erysiphe neolycopersici]|uniref:Putative nucleoporin nup49 n=1 Tax=Erysiphe neolycopersici TaxID=212602 RepID=A0A420HUB7_9PEZI|nr:putative nucleoporin nup49 [Erysiphe neolycopersici]